jgi:hypothetical protein
VFVTERERGGEERRGREAVLNVLFKDCQLLRLYNICSRRLKYEYAEIVGQ